MKIITIENLYDYKLGELMEEIKGDRNVVVSLTTTFSKKFDSKCAPLRAITMSIGKK